MNLNVIAFFLKQEMKGHEALMREIVLNCLVI